MAGLRVKSHACIRSRIFTIPGIADFDVVRTRKQLNLQYPATFVRVYRYSVDTLNRYLNWIEFILVPLSPHQGDLVSRTPGPWVRVNHAHLIGGTPQTAQQGDQTCRSVPVPRRAHSSLESYAGLFARINRARAACVPRRICHKTRTVAARSLTVWSEQGRRRSLRFHAAMPRCLRNR